MPLRAVRALAAATSLLLLAHCSADVAATREATSRAVDSITGGATDTMRRNVVGVVRDGRAGVSICTGSLILPNLVLTARHCVSPVSSDTVTCVPFTNRTTGVTTPATVASAPYDAGQFRVTTATSIFSADDFAYVNEVRVPPGTETSTVLCGNDVALLVLYPPIRDVGLIEPRLDARPGESEGFTAVGYGATDGAGTGSGRRRSRDGLSVAQVGEIVASGTRIQTESEWRGDTGTCRGDSGGPALDGVGQVMGVLSRGPRTCDTPVYQRVDSWSQWLRAEAARAIALIGPAEPAPRWLAPPVEGSARFGDACRGDTECAEGLACAIVGPARRCTSFDCNECPADWICGEVAGGIGCVPDPAVQVPDPPPDAGGPVPDGGAVADGSLGSPGMPPAPAPISTHGGCAAAPRGGSSGSDAALVAGALAGIALARSRRRRGSAA